MNIDRLSLSIRATLLAATVLAGTPVRAADDQPAAPATTAPGNAAAESDDENVDDIVVTAPRLAGQLDTNIAAEVELDEAAVASYGASSIAELLTALAPQTRSGRGRGSGMPIILVNGRRISGFGAVRNIPPEAIRKVEIFPEEVALQYGYAATDRVVNFVLKPDFRQIAIEVEGGIPTQGGRFQSEVQPSLMTIGKNGRLNLNVDWQHQTMLRETDRNLTYDDPARAAQAAVRSLLPASDTYVIDGTLVRGIDKLTEASLSLRYDRTDSLSLLGPDMVSGDALRRDSRTQNLTGSASANGRFGGWRWSVTGNYTDSESRIFTGRSGGSRDRFDSDQQGFGGNANISGSLVDGWAGPIRASVTAGYSGQRYDSRAERGVTITTSDLSRDTPSVLGSLTVPLLDPAYEAGKVGRVTLTLSGQIENPSDFSTLKSWGTSLNWGLTRSLSLLVSFNHDEAAPSMIQLGAAPLVTPDVTYYDLATGQTVQISTTSGGNPFLLAEQRRDFKLGLNWAPPMLEGLNFSVNYNRNQSDDTSNSFPLLTPEIEAAFPGRVTRVGGVLVALDQRPVNFDRAENSQIRWGFNFGKSFGQPTQGQGGPRPAGSGEGARPAAGGGQGQGGPGGMRGRGPGGPGGMFGGPQGGRWQVSLYHTVKLTDRVIIGPGVPELDLLHGSATGANGGSNRNLVELDGGLFYKGFGARVSAKYDSGSTVVGGANGDLKFGELATFNLRMFLDFNQRPNITKAVPLLRGSRLRLAIDNLFDAQRKITDASGRVPFNYQPGYLDPLGRYVELEWRKAF